MTENITLACALALQLVLIKSPNLKSRHLPLQLVGINLDKKG